MDKLDVLASGIVDTQVPKPCPLMALAISSGSEQLLYISDVVLHPIHLEQPDWYPAFDFVPEQAMATRRQLLHRVAAEKILMIACHFSFPGLGHVIQKGRGVAVAAD